MRLWGLPCNRCVCVHGVRLLQQQEEALEREHAAAACRLREASERWEGQLQATRMRLMAENDIKVGTTTTHRDMSWC